MECNAVQTSDRHIRHAVDFRVIVKLPSPNPGVFLLERVVLLLLHLEHGDFVFGVVLLHSLKDILSHQRRPSILSMSRNTQPVAVPAPMMTSASV